MANKFDNIFNGKIILFLDGWRNNNFYHEGIIQSLQDMGAIVTSRIFSNYRKNNFIFKIHRKILHKNGNINSDKLLDSLEFNYDIILVKNPEFANHDFFIKLRKKYPDARFINYNWNSLKISNFLPFVKYFDKVITFDPKDARENNLYYYPLFYLKDFENCAVRSDNWKYDISFVGSDFFGEERRNFIKSFIERLNEFGLTHNINLLVNRRTYIKYKYFTQNHALKGSLILKYISKKEFLNIVACSKSFVDFKRPFQSGHDMRTFETLAAGQMLITNDTLIRESDFYDPARIIIIDEKNKNYDLLPLKNYVPSCPVGFEKYRIDYWLKNILSDMEKH